MRTVRRMIKRFQKSLTMRFSGLFLLVALLPLTIMAGLEYFNAKTRLANTREQQLVSTGILVSENLQNYYNRLLDTLFINADHASSFLSLLNRKDRNEQKDLIKKHEEFFEKLRLFNNNTQILLTDASGHVVFSVGGREFLGKNLLAKHGDFSGSPVSIAIRQAITQGEWRYAPDYDYDYFNIPLAEKPFKTAFFVIPLLDKNNNTTGTMAMGTKTGVDTQQIVKQTRSILPSVKAYVTDRKKRVRYGERIVNTEPRPSLEKALISPWLDEAQTAGEKMVSYETIKGVRMLAVARPLTIANNEMLLILEIPEKQAFMSAYQFRDNMIWLFIIIIVFALPVSCFLAARVSRPVKRLGQWAREVSRGNFSYREIRPCEDEVGELSHSFTSMVRELRKKSYITSAQTWLQNGLISLNALLGKNTALKTQAKYIIDWLCHHADLEYGEIWFRKEITKNTQRPLLLAKHDTGTLAGCVCVYECSFPLAFQDKHYGTLALKSARPFSYLQKKFLEMICEPVVTCLYQLCQEQRLKKNSQYKSDFLSTVSHELRTPLHSILTLSETLAENNSQNLSDTQKTSIDTIYHVGQELLHTINDILDLSKVEAGQLAIKAESFRLDTLLQSLEVRFSQMVNEKRINFEIINIHQQATLYTDRHRLTQILQNLIGNAIKFTDKGSIKLTVSNTAKGKTQFSVSDTGQGISTEDQRLVFEPFSRGTHQCKGTGLGLAVSQRLARLIGGKIELESHVGNGSVFTLTLPASRDMVQNQPPFITGNNCHYKDPGKIRKSVLLETTIDEADKHALQGLRILVFHRNLQNMFYLSSVLEPLGSMVYMTNTKDAFNKKMADNTPDIVLVDEKSMETFNENESYVKRNMILLDYSKKTSRAYQFSQEKKINMPCHFQLLIDTIIKYSGTKTDSFKKTN